jgi:hypothetical protein
VHPKETFMSSSSAVAVVGDVDGSAIEQCVSFIPTDLKLWSVKKLGSGLKSEMKTTGTHMTRFAQHATRVGAILIEAKARLGHGKWTPWLEANFAGDSRSAQRYMAATREMIGKLQEADGDLGELTNWVEQHANALASKTTSVSDSPEPKRVIADTSELPADVPVEEVDGHVVEDEDEDVADLREAPRRHLEAIPDPEDEGEAEELDAHIEGVLNHLLELHAMRETLLNAVDFFTESHEDLAAALDEVEDAVKVAREKMDAVRDLIGENFPERVSAAAAGVAL